MSHSDDDGLVLPPRLAPQHAVVLPIYRNADERAQVLPYCENVKRELESQTLDAGPLRVMLDDRDLRGGEKNWQHIKRGVPLRVEIGPKDIAKDGVFAARRDTGEKQSTPRAQFVSTAAQTLQSIQDNLFARARTLRDENTRNIDDLAEFQRYFTPLNDDKPEIHGGFALCHLADEQAADELLKKLKVTVRCLPLAAEAEPGRCIFTGRPSARRALFAKAY
jgi:prolyl-tRNA synthetase